MQLQRKIGIYLSTSSTFFSGHTHPGGQVIGSGVGVRVGVGAATINTLQSSERKAEDRYVQDF
jgi:hypothetical protein